MLFNSCEFIFLFLPIVLFVYYALLRKRGRMVFLTLMSYVFYGWWDYRFCALMLVSTLIDYAAGIGISVSKTQRGRKGWMIMSIVSNLSLLGFFKYFDLGAGTINYLAQVFGHDGNLVRLLHVTLPVGISFYTFQSMSYSIDLYLGTAKRAKGFWDFACYVALYPQLVAGPIVRYHELADQLVERTHTLRKMAVGITFFILGLAKKVLLADGVAPLVTNAFGASDPGLLTAWGGVLAYAMQIYFDFSGYSDMAVGLGLMLGFEFPQNFNSPYKAVSITDFWRRWHISLSTWLRDYLYIPLGGNKLGTRRTYINLFLTMLLGGLWHGANWTFLIWGGYHGTLLAIERAAGKRGLMWWAPLWVQRLATLVLVCIGWVLFRCWSLDQAGSMFAGMLGFHGIESGGLPFADTTRLARVMLPVTMMLAWGFRNTWEMRPDFDRGSRLSTGLALALGLLFALCVRVIVVNSSSPFLYFQF
jgi:alginate O-acetyltransferase complex protein AlgI